MNECYEEANRDRNGHFWAEGYPATEGNWDAWILTILLKTGIVGAVVAAFQEGVSYQEVHLAAGRSPISNFPSYSGLSPADHTEVVFFQCCIGQPGMSLSRRLLTFQDILDDDADYRLFVALVKSLNCRLEKSPALVEFMEQAVERIELHRKFQRT